MKICLIGMNHKTAPVALRERIAQVCQMEANPLERVPRCSAVEELLYLSTCNRVEFLFAASDEKTALREVKELMFDQVGLPRDAVEKHIYVYHHLDAVRHLFRVASGLDSMVVGEPQILGQIKDAYRKATQYKTVGTVLNRLLHKTFSVAKRVRTETNIGCHAVSVSYAAVELARKIFGDLRDKRVMLIGAGEMAELAAEHLLAQRVRGIVVANRTLERALDLAARFRGRTVAFDQILDAVLDVDIVISSTGAPGLILTYDQLKGKMRRRKNKPLFFIDIAVPRDIDPDINRIDNVYLYDIDDLKGIVDLNLSQRRREAQRAEHIIEAETLRFQQWLQTLDVVPTIIALRRKAESIRNAELRRTFSQLPHLGEKEREAIAVLTESIVKKMLHDPILFLKKKSVRDSKRTFVDFTQQLFNLNEDGRERPSSLDSPDR